MPKRTKRIRVRVLPHQKPLRIYDPNDLSRPTPSIPGGVVLEGEVRKIQGKEWVIFPTQRNLGLPIETDDERVEVDLNLAQYYNQIEYELIGTTVKETVP